MPIHPVTVIFDFAKRSRKNLLLCFVRLLATIPSRILSSANLSCRTTVSKSSTCQRKLEYSGCRRSHLRCLRPTNQSIVGRRTCAVCVSGQSADDRPYNLRIERFEQRVQFAPRRDVVDPSEESVSPRELFLGVVFEVREALLHHQWQARNVALLSQVAVPAGTGAAKLITVSLRT